MKIGITQSETSYSNYPKWIKGGDNIEIIELSYDQNNVQSVFDCDGIVLTGGIDIQPINKEYENAPSAFNPIRDQFEMQILSIALEQGKPILGVCRGLQLINLYFGGTLILDLGIKNLVHRKGEVDKIHEINIDKNSLLYKITGHEIGFVNSAHHQSINQLANQLNISAVSLDNVIEAVELKNNIEQFLLGIQWHPERMEDQNSPFSKNIRESFLEYCFKNS